MFRPNRLFFISLAGILVTSVLTGTGIMRGATTTGGNCGPDYGWLTTRGNWIVSYGDPSCRVRLAGATWYGFQSTNFAPVGLDYETYQAVLGEIARLGFNSVRIPLSDQLVKHNKSITIPPKWLKAEPKWFRRNLHPLRLLDDIVKQAAVDHLMVILDNHFSRARDGNDVSNNRAVRFGKQVKKAPGTACEYTTACPLWYGDGYSQSQWLADWKALAQRYLHYPNVIGFDLRNEPHTTWQGHNWNMTSYVTGGSTWGPCTKALCGRATSHWKKSTDWAAAATWAGNQILKINPHLLMFVEGTQLYPEPSAKDKVEPYWWGSILKGVETDPIVFTVPNQLVYSPHEWGPWKCCGDETKQEFGSRTTYASISKIFRDNWAYILTDPKVQAPIWLGEFNTCNSPQPKTRIGPIKAASACVAGSKPGSEGQWFQILIKYLQQNPEIGWAYYPINATNTLNEASNNSILGCPQPAHCKPWAQPRLPLLMRSLDTVGLNPAH